MANLIDYLEWRGDIPFAVDPFNEVDGLLLAVLAYMDFGNVSSDGTAVSIQGVYKEFLKKHTREEISARGSNTAKAALILGEMCKGMRFRNTKLCYYINDIDREEDAQISAVTSLLDDGTAYVAFRGTDRSLVGWKEDFNLFYLSETGGQRRAKSYLNEVGASLGRKLRVGGHSKGGNFAVYAASFCDEPIQSEIIEVYSFDGPGFRKDIIDSDGYKRILPKIISIVPDTSVVGMLLSSASIHRVVKSTAVGILQHDGFTWAVCRNRFIQAPMSEMGRLIQRTMGGWLEQIDNETRQSLTNTIFSLLEATGQDTFDSISEQKWKSAAAMITSMAGLPKEKRQELLRLVGKLIQSGGQSAAFYLPRKIYRKTSGKR